MEGGSTLPVSEMTYDSDAPSAQEGTVSPLSVEDSRWGAYYCFPLYALHEEFLRGEAEHARTLGIVATRTISKGESQRTKHLRAQFSHKVR